MARRIRLETPEAAPAPVRQPVTAAAGPEAPVVRIEVFLAACGIRRDQTAGFQSWAKRQGLGPRPMSAWRQALAEFGDRVVR